MAARLLVKFNKVSSRSCICQSPRLQALGDPRERKGSRSPSPRGNPAAAPIPASVESGQVSVAGKKPTISQVRPIVLPSCGLLCSTLLCLNVHMQRDQTASVPDSTTESVPPATSESPEIAAAWTRHHDPATNRTYYYNTITRRSSWTHKDVSN